MKKLGRTASFVIIMVCMVPMFVFGLASLLIEPPERSESENRVLEPMPELTSDGVFSGRYMQELSAHYADAFPMREAFMKFNKLMNSFYFYQGGGDQSGAVIIEHTGADGGTGETVLDFQSEHNDQPSPSAGLPANDGVTATPRPSPTPSATPTPAPTPPPTPAPTPANFPDKSEAQQAGNVVVFGTRAMEIVYAKPDVMTRFAQAVNDLAAAMPDVQSILMVAPNSGEFYSAEDMHSGSTSQKAIIDTVYSQLDSGVIGIDAYDKLSQHTDEYIYFRTDHHWTALGAYYAYTAFCERMGLEPTPLSEFETGEYTDFVGSMYRFTANYPVSQVLLDNPDTLTYYFPVVETKMTIYPDGPAMQKPLNYPVINTKIGDYANKYICFIGGDNELTRIETSVKNGKSILISKESYGNAFIPFLTAHYENIWVIDLRKLNGKDQPSFNMAEFTAQHNIQEVLYLHYPFVVVSKTYCDYMEGLR